MLQTLRVKNLAIVENVHVEFGDGLNVLTGETGAGKSIILGALNLVLGERADKSLVRAGETRCGVEAVFQLDEAGPVNALLDDLGLEPCEEGRLIVRRIVAASGAGKNLVNDCPATLQVLKQLGTLLVDMHGPHDHQSLLDREFQMDLLDAFGQLRDLRSEYGEAYRDLRELESRRRDLEGSDDEVSRRLDMLRFQIKEIEEAQLDETDEDDLEQEHTTVANAQRILELGGGVCRGLTDGEGAAFDGLAACRQALQELATIYPEADEWQKEAESTAVQIQELSQSIGSAMQSIEGDPARLQWLEDRKALIHKLKRKYGQSVPDILAFLERCRQEVEDLETREEQIAEVDKALSASRGRAESKGSALGKARRRAATSLAESITGELRALGFSRGSFHVDLTTSEPHPSGMDAIEFGFAPNVGEAMRPLRAVASSGEISRVMLAVKAVLAAHDRIPVMVFDEIDANLGGEMGHAVGSKLAAVAGKHQVLCITHLPQVAVHGRTHFVVFKQVKAGRTRTLLQQVQKQARIEEVARMLGGKDSTSVTLKHAREMLSNAAGGKT